MISDQSEIADYLQFKQPIVRALLWVLKSPFLLASSQGSAELVASNWGHKIIQKHRQWLLDLDQNPQPLLDWVNEKPSYLLGVRFEKLLLFVFRYLQQQQDIDKLHHQLVIEDEARTTLGELDLLFQDKQTRQYYHWENAVKFYLLRGDCFGFERLVGVNGGDWFSRKMEHLFARQLGMSRTPEGRMGIARCFQLDSPQQLDLRRQAFVKGAIFYPLDGSVLNHEEQQQINPSCVRGRWCYADQFHLADPQQRGRWRSVSKLEWIVPQFYPYHDDNLLKPNEMQIKIKSHFLQSRRSLMLVHFLLDEETQLWVENERLVLVDKLWPGYKRD